MLYYFAGTSFACLEAKPLYIFVLALQHRESAAYTLALPGSMTGTFDGKGTLNNWWHMTMCAVPQPLVSGCYLCSMKRCCACFGHLRELHSKLLVDTNYVKHHGLGRYKVVGSTSMR